MKRELKIALSAVAATVAGIASVAIVCNRNKNKAEESLSECNWQDCNKCPRCVGQCEDLYIFLNFEEAMNTLPAKAMSILSEDEIKLTSKCLEYITYDYDNGIVVAYSVKCNHMVYIKINYDTGSFEISGRKESLC